MLQGLRHMALLGAALLMAATSDAWPAWDADTERLIAPSVVLQGELAVHLAQALQLPEVADEDATDDTAVRALTDRGIAPAQGWMTDYPVTPQIVAELRQTITDAASAGRLDMDPESAVSAFLEVIVELGLPQPEEPAPAYADSGTPVVGYAPACDPGMLDDYYVRYGLPYYTYCSPPVAYFYLYTWVPYRFIWHDHHHHGYFILKVVRVFPSHARPHHKYYKHRYSDRHPVERHEPSHRSERRVIRIGPAPHAGDDRRPPERRHATRTDDTRSPASSRFRDRETRRFQAPQRQYSAERRERVIVYHTAPPTAVPPMSTPPRAFQGRLAPSASEPARVAPHNPPRAAPPAARHDTRRESADRSAPFRHRSDGSGPWRGDSMSRRSRF
jgi:hypothetical protein